MGPLKSIFPGEFGGPHIRRLPFDLPCCIRNSCSPASHPGSEIIATVGSYRLQLRLVRRHCPQEAGCRNVSLCFSMIHRSPKPRTVSFRSLEISTSCLSHPARVCNHEANTRAVITQGKCIDQLSAIRPTKVWALTKSKQR